jgi:hypothetical protein
MNFTTTPFIYGAHPDLLETPSFQKFFGPNNKAKASEGFKKHHYNNKPQRIFIRRKVRSWIIFLHFL